MPEIRVPREDVNDDTAVVARWLAEAGARVEAGQPLCELETTKTVFTVCAPASGVFYPAARQGDELPVGAVLARVGGEAPPASLGEACPVMGRRATRRAAEFASRHGIDLQELPGRGIITLEEVRSRVHTGRPSHVLEEPVAWTPPSGERRVLVLGAGKGAHQVIDILRHDPEVRLVGCLDDHPALKGARLLGVPVLGSLGLLESLWQEGAFDEAVVGIGSDMPLRIAWFERCRRARIPMANAVDPSARFNLNVRLGEGNVICSFVHLGVGAVLGDNNFVAAHTSVDHHCRIGSHVLLGPGCHLSGAVRVGDDVLFGSGVVVQPGISIGSGCRIASGSVILRDLPAGHAVRLRPTTHIGPVRALG